jgi:hypothetical protein
VGYNVIPTRIVSLPQGLFAKTGKTLPNGKLLPVSKNCRASYQIMARPAKPRFHLPHYQFACGALRIGSRERLSKVYHLVNTRRESNIGCALSRNAPQNSGSLDLKSAREGVDQLRNLAKSITVEEMVESTVILWR